MSTTLVRIALPTSLDSAMKRTRRVKGHLRTSLNIELRRPVEMGFETVSRSEDRLCEPVNC